MRTLSTLRNPTTLTTTCAVLISIIALILALPSQVTAPAFGRLNASFIRLSPVRIRPNLGIKYLISTTPFQGRRVMAYESELRVAQLAVARAAILTKSVFHEKAKGTVSKDDKSPVTIGDFGAQALIIAAIKHNFPQDEVVGEEDADTLRADKNLSSSIWNLVQAVKLSDPESDALLGGPIKSEADMLDALDKGSSAGGSKGRIWALDPIDGTKGFLRGGQYAVCLALMVDGDVKVGVLGCPNLPVDDTEALTEDIGSAATDAEGKGVLFSAIQGQGATSQPLTTGAVNSGKAIHVSKIDNVSQAVLCESVEPGHSSKGDNAAIAQKLGITGKPVQMDSQAKYGSVARGAGDLYLRLPVRKDYIEKIWDHAAGDLIVREAGGQVTDIKGNRLDFSKGRTLTDNKGVIASPANVHSQVLKAVQEVLAAKL
ncbi:3'(2'),5'-bisphosphate nucleotidase [Exophiala mesophila]|uniref:3'(2'),5'-bisphosphate nucleotidase n=1 Tax=Exophiala mesophila TaxID=212818 RepID=A0A438NCX0_EXOME|nr:3'(2'),5'-bisphosphate nucleotidase [Exophiala mesophila]